MQICWSDLLIGASIILEFIRNLIPYEKILSRSFPWCQRVASSLIHCGIASVRSKRSRTVFFVIGSPSNAISRSVLSGSSANQEMSLYKVRQLRTFGWCMYRSKNLVLPRVSNSGYKVSHSRIVCMGSANASGMPIAKIRIATNGILCNLQIWEIDSILMGRRIYPWNFNIISDRILVSRF